MEYVAFRETPFHTGWGADDKVHREPRGNRAAYFEGLIDLVPCRHDDQDVYVAAGMRRAVSVGAEQDDLVGVETLRHLAREAADQAHGDVGAFIPAFRLRFGLASLKGGHVIILPRTRARTPTHAATD